MTLWLFRELRLGVKITNVHSGDDTEDKQVNPASDLGGMQPGTAPPLILEMLCAFSTQKLFSESIQRKEFKTNGLIHTVVITVTYESKGF